MTDRKHIKPVKSPKPSNVTSLDSRRPTAKRAFVEPLDVMELVSYVDATDAGGLALALTGPPDGVPAWIVSSPDAVEHLGIVLIQFAAKMRRGDRAK